MTLFRTLLAGSALALAPLAVAPALAQDKPISQIDVSADFSEFENANALEFYPDLESDLRSELSDALSDQMADDGGRLEVIVSEVSVDGDALLRETTPFNRISAGVFYHEPTDGTGDQSRVPETSSVTVAAVIDESSIPEDATAYIMRPASDEAVYSSMIDGLANVIVRELAQM